MARQPIALDFAQSAKRLGKRDLRIGPVQQQQVDFALAQPHQRVAGSAFECARCEMRRPDIRRQKHLAALDAGGVQAFADLALIVVDFCGVDVAIAEPQSLLDHARARTPAQFPRAEPDQGNPGALGLDAGYGIDRAHLGCKFRAWPAKEEASRKAKTWIFRLSMIFFRIMPGYFV
jgi:hypothetical protein